MMGGNYHDADANLAGMDYSDKAQNLENARGDNQHQYLQADVHQAV